MKTVDQTVAREWVDLDLDGELGETEQAQLETRLEASSDLQAERQLLSSLHTMIGESRITVRSGFQEQVMSALPAAAWDRRRASRRTPVWALPAAVAAVFALAAALTVTVASDGSGSQTLGIAATVFDFLATTTLAGAGLLFASWRGVGFGLEQLMAQSGLNMVAFASLVLFVNLLFFNLLRRRSTVALPASDERSGRE